MSNKEQQIRNSFLYLLPVIIGNVLPFITIPIFTRILTPEDYGILALAQIYAIFAAGLANCGMTAAYERDFFEYRSDRLKTAQLLYSVLLFVMVNFLLLATLTYVYKGTLSKLIIGSEEYEHILFWAFCAQFFSSISYYYLTYFKNEEKAKDFITYTIVGSAINLFVSLFLVVQLRIGVIGIVYAQLCYGIVIFGILTFKFGRSFTFSVDRGVFIKALRIGYPLTPRLLVGIVGRQVDKYMIGLLGSLGGVGIYSIGQRVSYVVFTYMTAVQNVFSPQVYQRMFDRTKKGSEAIGTYLTPFVYICMGLALVVSLFSEEVISILTPPSFHGAIEIVGILSVYYGLLFFGMLNGQQLIFAKKTHITSLLSMVSLVFTVGILIPFTVSWGAIGAAWGTLVGGLISGTMYFVAAQRFYEIKWEYRKVGAILITFVGFACLLILMRHAGVGYAMRIAVKLVAVSLYTLVGITIGVVNAENVQVLKGIITKSRIQKGERMATLR